ncbi:MAG TPA: PDZ domain-containing protein [Anaerolineae bacterium]|nr:PDZ domain-containing protein [Caldilineae bacterium]HID34561.1 PDZ domain-containing protein [Anaerolineae bacterium]HIQ12337.1 PDZ domain-containing protein [Caldilineales bacterium]
MFGFDISTLAIIAVVPVLGFLIFIHELGHFLAARWMGVRVLEFGFGYPPRMIKLFERNGVEYTFNWIPFGGFVRMAGEDGDDDDPHALPNVAPWRRIVVMAAGPFMNLVTAVFIFTTLFMVGVFEYDGDLNALPVRIEGVAAESPAAQAGVQPGDVILAIRDQEVLGVDNVKRIIEAHAGEALAITLRRGDDVLTVRVRPRLPEEIPSGQGALGVRIGPAYGPEDVHLVRYGFFLALAKGVQRTWNAVVMLIAGLVQLFVGFISPSVPAPEGGVGGVVAIGRITAEFARQGWRDLLNWTALLSVMLGVLNLLPIPALDGGRILFALTEMVSRRRIPPEKEALVHMAGFIILVGVMILVTFMDISNWIAGKPPIPGG